MGVDYYNILKVSKMAGEDELRKAYKKLVMRWHPDKHPDGAKQLAEAKFKQICEAYDVLSDPSKRQIYDLYGEEGVKSGQFSNGSSPSAGAERGGGSACERDVDELLAEFFSGGGGGGGRKAAAVENKLGCSLEELYKGSKRKLKISRVVPDDFGKPRTVEEVLAIDIQPGWKRGTKITFPGKGNQEPGLLPGDLIFVIEEKPHSVFKRDGNDLVLHQRLSLLDALTGKTLHITTLDGRTLNIEVTDIVKPGREIVIPNEGMPISKDPNTKGNLRIKFDVKFPSRLSAEQKSDLRRVLGASS